MNILDKNGDIDIRYKDNEDLKIVLMAKIKQFPENVDFDENEFISLEKNSAGLQSKIDMLSSNIEGLMGDEKKTRDKMNELMIQSVDKVNETLDGLTLRDTTSALSISPTIYINDMYKHYLKVEDLDIVFTAAADRMMQGMKMAPDEVQKIDYENAKDNIVFQLINTEQNKEML